MSEPVPAQTIHPGEHFQESHILQAKLQPDIASLDNDEIGEATKEPGDQAFPYLLVEPVDRACICVDVTIRYTNEVI